MKTKIMLSGLLTALAVTAAPAFAQSASGAVALSGTVGDKCLVTNAGAVASPGFGGIVNLNALDDGTTAKLRNVGAISPTSNNNLNFRVVCTTAAPKVAVTTTALTTGSGTASTGYSATVHYDTAVAFDIADAAQPDTVLTYTDGVTGPASKTASLTGRLATGTTNIHVSATNFRTPAAADVLVAGSYAGAITISVSPI